MAPSKGEIMPGELGNDEAASKPVEAVSAQAVSTEAVSAETVSADVASAEVVSAERLSAERLSAEGVSAGGSAAEYPAAESVSGLAVAAVIGAPYDQDVRTVRRLRFGIAAIGLLLPVVLPLGNWVFVQFGHQTQIMPSSMSSSYYTSTRNIFVGSLCALGVFLIGYRAKATQDVWTTIVGLFAIGVALFPTAPLTPTDYQSAIGYTHLAFALVLLSGLAVFCITSFHRETNAARETTNYTYLGAGVAILLFLLVAIVAGLTHWGEKWTLTPLYTCEALSVWAFGVAWLAAAVEIGRPPAPAAARRALRTSSQGPGVSSILGHPL